MNIDRMSTDQIKRYLADKTGCVVQLRNRKTYNATQARLAREARKREKGK